MCSNQVSPPAAGSSGGSSIFREGPGIRGMFYRANLIVNGAKNSAAKPSAAGSPAPTDVSSSGGGLAKSAGASPNIVQNGIAQNIKSSLLKTTQPGKTKLGA